LFQGDVVNKDSDAHRVTFAEAIGQFASWLNPKSRFIKAVIEVS